MNKIKITLVTPSIKTLKLVKKIINNQENINIKESIWTSCKDELKVIEDNYWEMLWIANKHTKFFILLDIKDNTIKEDIIHNRKLNWYTLLS